MTRGDESFGKRMAEARAKGEIAPAGRPPLRAKYHKQLEAVEASFAKAAPALALDYLDELRVREPERCPEHHRVLRCPADRCGHTSQRTAYDFKATAYIFDRLLGRPTVRAEVQEEATINLAISAEYLHVREIIIGALEPYPDARLAVVEALQIAEPALGR